MVSAKGASGSRAHIVSIEKNGMQIYKEEAGAGQNESEGAVIHRYSLD